METLTNAINWFDIPVLDIARAEQFYSTVLGTTLQPLDMPGLQMRIFPHDMNGGVGGALSQGEGYVPAGGPTGPVLYLNAGPDLAVALGRVAAAGGQVLLPKTLISADSGYFALFLDTEGNRVGLHSMA